MRNILLTLSYKGTRYHGSQVQKNALSVIQVVQDAIQAVYHQRYDIKGCSRTDAGVHANMYCLNFRTESPMPVRKIPLALNAHLPGDISVYRAQQVPDDFHARYSCSEKEYVYKLLDTRFGSPFYEELSYVRGFGLNADDLHRQAQQLVGTHDFRAFCSQKTDQQNTTRTVSHFSVQRCGDLVTFTVRADGFLYNMVRIMVGTLIGLDTGTVHHRIDTILNSGDRSLAGHTAPARGLYLNRVFYPDIRP
ncbi:tRNA pseudouridine(38-40) synthase TruA [Neobittarella massiliensis]|uniref:tRNA pseudouridine(38-40) synthase TruA n=1 Tax=Neobittarella massiliensis (ex Bilen et al. 2018) TaxID=2041842 RepID=UPI000CF6F7E7|nr:tRNA pseudouridine(38-40) synthase TruA [Neobittarella massiliensis]